MNFLKVLDEIKLNNKKIIYFFLNLHNYQYFNNKI